MPYQGETQLIKSRSKSLTLYSLHHLTKCREILEKWNSMNRTGRNIELQALEWWGMHVSYRLYNLLYRHESEAAFLILSSCFILTTNSRHWAYLTALELLRGTSAIANRRRGEVCVCGGGGGGGWRGGRNLANFANMHLCTRQNSCQHYMYSQRVRDTWQATPPNIESWQ